jgi:hypothetical protein
VSKNVLIGWHDSPIGSSTYLVRREGGYDNVVVVGVVVVGVLVGCG